ncbi:MAG: hypothetical protein E6I30_10805 [Chloroflexi bacterium]|nr:MAG: hypothetical protein E6I30_10805 [Chloroflexota bacterium]
MAGLLPARPCCQLSELLGVYYGSRGRLLGNPPGRSAYFSLLRNVVARKVVRLGRAVAHMEAKYQAVKTSKRMSFFLELALPAELVPAFSHPPARGLPDVMGVGDCAHGRRIGRQGRDHQARRPVGGLRQGR